MAGGAGGTGATARARRAVDAGYAVRPMRASDAVRVAQVHVQVWHEAYTSLMPAEHLAGLEVDELTAAWRQRLARPTTPDGVRHLVGVRADGGIVGLGTAGPGRDPEPPAGWELWALNVLGAEHGTGLADLLLAELIGRRACYLWVLRGNLRAVAFYTRHRFTSDGSTKLHPPTGLTEDRMTRGARR